MTMRSIVCLFDGMDQEYSALETAIGMAVSAAAHLRIIHVRYPVVPAISAGGGEIYVGAEFLDAINRAREEMMQTARKFVVELCRAHGLPLDDQDGGPPRAAFGAMTPGADLTRELSLCDIIVLGAEPNEDVLSRTPADTALFHSGRPVLIVRPRSADAPAKLAGGGCAIAWNGTPECIRAIVNALPLIEDAATVSLLVTDDTHAEEPARSRVAASEYLAAHGIAAKLEVVERRGRSAAEAILDKARDLRCDVIVMGAYGHSVFRESILGGFSEHMLKNCESPLVMCH